MKGEIPAGTTYQRGESSACAATDCDSSFFADGHGDGKGAADVADHYTDSLEAAKAQFTQNGWGVPTIIKTIQFVSNDTSLNHSYDETKDKLCSVVENT